LKQKKTYTGTKSKSTQCHVALECYVALTMPHVTHRDLTHGIFIFFPKI